MAENLAVQVDMKVDVKIEATDSVSRARMVEMFAPTAKEMAAPIINQPDGSAGTYTSVGLGNITTVNMLFLKSSRTITVRLNGTIVLADVTYVLLQMDGITSLEIDNHSGEEATVEIVACGD